MATQDLTTLAQVREHQQQTDATNTSQDGVISDLITVASDLIIRYCQREFAPNGGSTPSARFYRYDGNGVLTLAPDDARSVTQVRIDTDTTSPTTLTADTDYKLWPTRARDGVYTHLHLYGFTTAPAVTSAAPSYREVEVTGTWGWASVPVAVERACIILTLELLSRTSSFRAGDFDDLGSPMGGAAIPLHVRTMLSSYRRRSVGY